MAAIDNPDPTFEQVIWQLTKAEFLGLMQFHLGLT